MAPGSPVANPHPADLLSQDVLDYVEEMSDYLARSILGSPLSPATAPMTSAQKLQYFSRQFWMPDGQPNQQGRDALQAKYGARGFQTIVEALAKRHGQLSADVTDQADTTLPEPDQEATSYGR